MMDWDKLRIFHAAAEAGSFTHAADKLHLSQSAVSRQILLLEEELNEQLFLRLGRKIQITPAGTTLLRAHRFTSEPGSWPFASSCWSAPACG